MELFYRFGVFVLILALMLLWERLRPFRSFSQTSGKRLGLNLSLMTLNFLVLRIFSGGGAFLAAGYALEHGYGLFNIFIIPEWLTIIASLLILDFAIYLQHLASHKIPLLWRFHRVHHTDLGFDASTSIRFHPIEIIFSMYYKMALALVFGISPWVVVVFEVSLNAFALFNHGNVTLPETWDRRLRWLLVTPDMHRIHHSAKRSETDSNYGFSVTWWDRLCLTYSAYPDLGQQQMIIGTAEERDHQLLGFKRLLKLPFEKMST